jgi:hypothetical protein
MNKMCPYTGIACWESDCKLWNSEQKECKKVLLLNKQIEDLDIRG